MKLQKVKKQAARHRYFIALAIVVVTCAAAILLSTVRDDSRSKVAKSPPAKNSSQPSQYCFASDQVCVERPEGWKYVYESEHLPSHCLEKSSQHSAPIICWNEKLDGSDLPGSGDRGLHYVTLISQTPIGNTGISDVQLAHRRVYEGPNGRTGFYTEEFLLPTSVISQLRLQLGQEVRLSEPMERTFTIPLTSSTTQIVYLMANNALDPNTGEVFTSLQSAVDSFNHPDAQAAHKIMKSTTITIRS